MNTKRETNDNPIYCPLSGSTFKQNKDLDESHLKSAALRDPTAALKEPNRHTKRG